MAPEGEELPELSVPDATAGGATLAGVLGDRYQTVARLGAGAFGEVYRAHDRLLGRDPSVRLQVPRSLEQVPN